MKIYKFRSRFHCCPCVFIWYTSISYSVYFGLNTVLNSQPRRTILTLMSSTTIALFHLQHACKNHNSISLNVTPSPLYLRLSHRTTFSEKPCFQQHYQFSQVPFCSHSNFLFESVLFTFSLVMAYLFRAYMPLSKLLSYFYNAWLINIGHCPC